MGACNIDLTIKKKASIDEIRTAFRGQQELDSAYNGHQEGYSGDFQTVQGVELHKDKVFKDYNEAYDYCLDNAEKWDYVVAVYYKHGDPKYNSEVRTLIAGWGAC